MNGNAIVLGAVEFTGELATYGSKRPRSVYGPRDVLVVSGWIAGTAHELTGAVSVQLDGVAVARAVVAREDAERLGFRAVVALDRTGYGPRRISVSAGIRGVIVSVMGPEIIVIDPARVAASRFVMLDNVEQTLDPSRVECEIGDRLRGHGWALDPDALVRPYAVVVIVDERYVFEALQGIERADVAELLALSDPALGFDAEIETEVVGPGAHTMVARMIYGDRHAELESENGVNFFVNPI